MCIAGVQREWAQMLIWEHPARFTEVHSFRYVNNLYLDTFRHSYYADHVAGVST